MGEGETTENITDTGLKQRSFDLKEHADPAKKSWFCVYTGPQQEKKLASALDKRKITHYLPVTVQKRQWSDRVKKVEIPLLKGYLFVRINWLSEKRTVLQMPGVIGFVKLDELPVVIHPAVISSLKILIESTQDVKTDPYSGFPVGQKVLIENGPLKGFEGYVKKVNSRTNIMVVIEEIGQVIQASFSPEDIGPV